MKRILSHIILSVCLISSINIFAQDVLFTQFYSTPMVLSPSFAGTSIENRLASNYRNQWTGISKAFVTYNFSYDRYVPEFNSGIGIMFTHDRAGDGALRATNVAMQYAYEARLWGKTFFRPGLQFTWSNRNINFNDLVFSDQLVRGGAATSLEQEILEPINYFDFGTGGLIFNQSYWIGAAVHHLNQPRESLFTEFGSIPRRYSVHAGWRHRFKGNVFKKSDNAFVMAAHYQSQANFDQLDIGAYLETAPITFGIWYRGLPMKKNNINPNNDAVAAIIGYYAGPYKIGYSYDITISSLGIGNSAGTHEISLVYEWANKRNIKLAKRRIMPCAKF